MKFNFLQEYRLQLPRSTLANYQGDSKDKYLLTVHHLPTNQQVSTNLWSTPYVDFIALHPSWRRAKLIEGSNAYYIYGAIINDKDLHVPRGYGGQQLLHEYLGTYAVKFVWNKTEPFNINNYISKKSLRAQDLIKLHQTKNMFCCRISFNPYKDIVTQLS